MKKILVADDEEILRMLIVDTLEDSGFAIVEAEDGKEALRFLENEKFDLAILDYMMPEKTGLEVIQSLKAEIKQNLQIVMLTAKAQQQDREAALQAGANYFIAKPFSPADLLTLVEEILS